MVYKSVLLYIGSLTKIWSSDVKELTMQVVGLSG